MSELLPTVTFLFTDVAGSTALWERAPDAMKGAMRRHDQLVEDAVNRHEGEVVRPRGEGDSRFAVFARPENALAGALRIQATLGEEPWPTPEPVAVRLAVHTGAGELWQGDWYGSDVNRCARLRAIGRPGQILVSGATAAAVSGLPDGAQLVDLGMHALKDLAEPEHVFQLTGPGVTSTFPQLLRASEANAALPSRGTVTSIASLVATSEVVRGVDVPRAALVFEDGSRVPVTSRCTLGRHPDNTIVVDDHKASRHHALVRLTADGTLLQDLGSTNGTFVNGERVGDRVLLPGDVVVVGRTALRYELDGGDAGSPPAV
jgi:class 3 adenylate cyclase